MKVLIVYYSTFGNVYHMAKLVAEGVESVAGASAAFRKVPELMPDSVIDGNEGMKKGHALQQDVPVVSDDDWRDAGAVAIGTPTRFGNMASQMKNQLDQLSGLWMQGELEDKPVGMFVSTASLHGGQETTILSSLAPLLHLGMIPVGVPYSTQELFTTQGGGSPYGPGHVAGGNNDREIDAEESAICRALGKRLANIGLKLQA